MEKVEERERNIAICQVYVLKLTINIIFFLYINDDLPNTVIDDDISMASSHTRAILNPVSRFVEVCRDPNGFLMPKYLPKLMKHMCKMLAEQANTSHVTYTLHQTDPKGQ